MVCKALWNISFAPYNRSLWDRHRKHRPHFVYQKVEKSRDITKVTEMVSGEEKLEKEPKSLNYSIYNNIFKLLAMSNWWVMKLILTRI